MCATEASLLERCRAGDDQAFEELYRKYSSRVYSLAVRFIGSRSEAEDLLQEIFLLVYRRLATFRGDAAVSTWIHRIAVNRCVDYVRSRGAKFADASRPLDDIRVPGRESHKPERRLVERLDLERAITMLPDGCRAAFVLHDVEGLQHSEIATVLGIAQGTSKSQVHRARLRLRNLLTTPRATEHGEAYVQRRVC